MYQRILVPVENSPYDEVILTHIRKLARTCNEASIVLIHVADGWAARNINQLDLRESEEMKGDREYIEGIADTLVREGYNAEAILAGGDPAKEIAACAVREKCDLIAMATHGHRGLSDVIRGSVASELRHISMLPVLMVRGTPSTSPVTTRPAG
jgi:nucleotide-binding universal stress UspA family protein